MKNSRHLTAPLALLLFCLGQTPARACAPDEAASAPLYLAVESPVSRKAEHPIGQGPHSYRFVVRDPQHIDRPYRNNRYQVNIEGDATFPDGRRVYRGTTDAQGRTASFHFAQPVPVDQWFVQPLSGSGELGESFRLSASGDCRHDLINYPYMLDGKLGPIFCGRALPGGTTVRYMLPLATPVQLYAALSTSECRALQGRVNPVMARATPAARIAGLQQLRRDRRLAEHEELLLGKIDALIIRHGSLAQIKAMLKRNLAEADASPKEQSAVYNSLGYDLLAQDPPRHLAYANELLDRSVSLEQNLYNIDSKGWALHLAGRHAEALRWMDRALSMYGTQCTESEQASYQETLAHRGMILWTLKQPTAALTDWAKADMASSGGGWANYIPPWNNIRPLLEIRKAELQAEGVKDALCSEVKPEEEEEVGGK
jgi:hypothetical protein